jgi:hypothetical protein
MEAEEQQVISPMPAPFTMKMSLIDVKDADHPKGRPMIAVEFHSFTGVAVYFFDKEQAQMAVNGFGQMIKKMMKIPSIPIFRSMPNG